MYAQDNNSLPVWILVTSLPNHISINSQPFLVGIVSNGNARLPERYSHDPLTLMDFMDSEESDESAIPCPIGLLGGGEHFADVSGGRREQIRLPCHQHQGNDNAQCEFPRNGMLHHVTEMDIHRPRPF